MAYTPHVYFNWNGDGSTWVDESNRCKAMKTDRGRKYRVAAGGKGFDKPKPGQAVFQLDNYDGRYDPDNTLSPLYPYVNLDVQVRIELFDGTTNYPLFRGRVFDITPMGFSTKQNYRFTVRDGWEWMKVKVYYNTQQNIPIDTALGYVLDASGYYLTYGLYWKFPATFPMTFGQDTSARSLQAAAGSLDYWWASGESALDAIDDLLNAEMGFGFFDKSGVFTFYSRNYLYTSTPISTIDQSMILREPSKQMPWANIRNSIRVRGNQVTQGSAVTFWTLPTANAIVLGPGETKTILVKVNTNGGYPQAVVTLNAPSYAANLKQDGTGSDVTSFVTLIATPYGQAIQLDLTNKWPNTVYVTSVTLGGTGAVQSNSFEYDAYSGNADAEFVLEGRWLQNPYKAKDIGDFLLAYLVQSSRYPELQVENQVSSLQFGSELYNRYTLNIPQLYLNGDYFLAGISHEWVEENGQGIRTTFNFEPAGSFAGAWVFPVMFTATTPVFVL